MRGACALPKLARGQALPLTLLFATLGGLALLVLYNLGQTIYARARLTHAAVAAA
jgi:hypothetical protein